MELIVIALFCIALAICGVLGVSVLYGLLVGLVIFSAYAMLKHFSFVEVLKMIGRGIIGAKSVLIVFLCIGILTGVWRLCGTIPALVCLAASFSVSSMWPLIAFLCNALVSFLIGTSFGTAATMGVVSMMMGTAFGCDPVLMGGVILSGCYFGDRCSFVSSSALLVSELTSTTVAGNIPGMLKSAAIPFVLTCLLYAALGFQADTGAGDLNIGTVVSQGFDLHPVVLIPALLILVLSLCKLGAKITLLASSVVAFVICLVIQGVSFETSLYSLIFGFSATGNQAEILNGGGIVSMLTPGAIVCIASAYAGIFEKTGLLLGFQEKLVALSNHITPFGGCCITSVITSMLACNQTLAIMLTHQMYAPLQKDNKQLALELEDSVVLIAPLIPWCIATTVPLAVVGAPLISIVFAAFLYLVPLCRLFSNAISKGFSK